MGWTVVTVAVALLVVLCGAVVVGSLRTTRATRALAERVQEQARASQAAGSAGALSELPGPVAAYLRRALPAGEPLPTTARLEQRGEILQSGRWRPFTAVQTVATDPPGFVWDARVRFMPLLGVRVVDRYLDGSGGLVARLAGTVPVAREEGGPAITTGELMRFVAELPWLPTTALPGPRMAWTPLGERSARATFRDAGTTVSLAFTFDAAGDIVRVEGDRPRSLPHGGSETRHWVGRFWDYREMGGVRVPTRGEVAWVMADGPEPYWRGEIVRASFGPR